MPKKKHEILPLPAKIVYAMPVIAAIIPIGESFNRIEMPSMDSSQKVSQANCARLQPDNSCFIKALIFLRVIVVIISFLFV